MSKPVNENDHEQNTTGFGEVTTEKSPNTDGSSRTEGSPRIEASSRTEGSPRIEANSRTEGSSNTGKGINIGKTAAVSTAFVLLFALSVGFIARFICPTMAFSSEENRMLQGRPDIRFESLLDGDFENEFEDYVNDQFPGRRFFVHLKSSLDLALGIRESNNVLLADNGYLMQKFACYNDATSAKKLDYLGAFMKKNKKLNHYFLMAPTAINTLADLAPISSGLGSGEHQNAKMDEFYDWFTKNGGKPIDVRQDFADAAHTQPQDLFYHTDHHWTSFGAHLAVHKTLKTMNLKSEQAAKIKYKPMRVYNNFRGALTYSSGFCENSRDGIDVYFREKNRINIIVSYVDEQRKSATLFSPLKLATKESYEVFMDGNHSIVKIQTNSPNKDALLIIKDSFANCFVPFLTPYYSEIVVIDPRYYYDSIREVIKAEKIDDILYLYNANTFFTDTSLTGLLTPD